MDQPRESGLKGLETTGPPFVPGANYSYDILEIYQTTANVSGDSHVDDISTAISSNHFPGTDNSELMSDDDM